MTCVSDGYMVLPMDLATRLRKAREAAGLTQEAAADAIGISSQAIAQWESGKTSPAQHRLRKVAIVYKVPIGWLLAESAPTKERTEEAEAQAPKLPPVPQFVESEADTGSDIDLGGAIAVPPVSSMPKDVPVLGITVGGSDGDFSLNGNTIDYVRRPPGILHAQGVFALFVGGNSMSPRYEDGDLIYLHPGRQPRIGDDIVLEMYASDPHGSTPCFIKRLRRRTAETIYCEQFNPPRDDLSYDIRMVRRIFKVMTPAELLGI